MTDDFRDLESELESLRPIEPSAALRHRVAEAGGGRRVARRLVIAAGSAAALAACVVMAVVLWRAGSFATGVHIKVVHVNPPPAPTTATAPTRPLRPALGVYAGALAQSPDALDHVLDRQAADLGAPARSPRPWEMASELTN